MNTLVLMLIAFLLPAAACAALMLRLRRMAARIVSLQEQARWYQDALRIAGAGVWQWDLRSNECRWIEDIFQVRSSKLCYRVELSDAFHNHVHPDDRERLKAMEAEYLRGRQSVLNDYRYRLDSGEERWLRDIGHLVSDDPPMMVGITLDITEEKLAALAKERDLSRDELTGLPNRRALMAWLEARLSAGGTLSLGFLDLNGFKMLNDRRGHAAGDRCLRAIGQTLAGRLAPDEFAARIGGDEFIVVVQAPPGGSDMDRLETLVRAALKAVATEVPKARIGAAAGLARFPHDAATPEALLSAADAAMYEAKATGHHMAFRPYGEAPARLSA